MQSFNFPIGRLSQIGKLDLEKHENKDFIKSFMSSIVVPDSDELDSILVPEKGVARRHSDVWLLTNVQRISNISPTALAEIIRTRFAERKVSNPYDGLSDDELFKTIKSRNIQSLSELKSYLTWLEDSGIAIQNEYNEVLASSVPSDPPSDPPSVSPSVSPSN